jgi:hypothetical protein
MRPTPALVLAMVKAAMPDAQRDVGCRWDYVGRTLQPTQSKWVRF